MTNNSIKAAAPFMLVCCPTTHISHTTVASMGKAIKVLNVTIHAPGFGSKLATLGTQLANK